MTALVLAEHENGVVYDATLAAITAASKLGVVHVLVAGDGAEATAGAEAASRIVGVEKVKLAAGSAYAGMLAENIAPLIAPMMAHYDVFVAPATTTGKNIAPRLAALLDVMQISEVTGIEGSRTFTRPIYAGNVIATIESIDPKLVLTVRSTAFEKASPSGGSAEIETISGPGDSGQSSFVDLEESKNERLELTSAEVVVSGGRALRDAATFEELIMPLADALGAAVGASRAAVDAGFISNEFQVGQTGKIVAPSLYIAVGISGAMQHLAGMKDSKVIVAINNDEDAPIFQVADIGLVEDLFTAVPELIEKIRQQ